jgi:cytochrome bd-type quinol oxidase subunit 2
MVIAMMLGMFVGYGIFLAIVGTSGAEARRLYPTASLLVMAVSMTVPMLAWMRFRRHVWRDTIEMGAAMLVPAVPFLVCLWVHVLGEAPNGPYMMVSTVAMIGLMLFRWNVYSVHAAKPLAIPGS